MSLFGPRFHSHPAEPNFSGLFRLIDDFDRYSTQGTTSNGGQRNGRHVVPSFTPKFDLKETETAYELHGELPGIEKEHVRLEFTDPQTIVIRGKVERKYSSGEPPAAGLLEEDNKSSGAAITESGEEKQHQHHSPKPHPVTVEDEDKEAKSTITGSSSDAQPTPGTTVAKSEKSQAQQAQQPKVKYWVSERSIGEFSRTFNFPTRVDADGVKASLNNGVLEVTVPKARRHEHRQITIN